MKQYLSIRDWTRYCEVKTAGVHSPSRQHTVCTCNVLILWQVSHDGIFASLCSKANLKFGADSRCFKPIISRTPSLSTWNRVRYRKVPGQLTFWFHISRVPFLQVPLPEDCPRACWLHWVLAWLKDLCWWTGPILLQQEGSFRCFPWTPWTFSVDLNCWDGWDFDPSKTNCRTWLLMFFSDLCWCGFIGSSMHLQVLLVRLRPPPW